MFRKLLLTIAVLSMIFAFNCAICSADVIASGECGAEEDGKNVTWELSGTETDMTLTLSGTGAMKGFAPVRIPWADKQDKIKEIVVGNGITNIGMYAFYNCANATRVTIPDSVNSIGMFAFSDCSSLKSIAIPNSVTSIGSVAFRHCTSLESITIPNSITSFGGAAFGGCSNVVSITIPDSVTYIGDSLFAGCSGLESVTIPASVTEISARAFQNCSSLKTATFLGDAVTLGEECFDATHQDFKIFYRPTSEGWTTPTWEGYPAYPHTHTYGEWVETKEASCDENGRREAICSFCEDKVTEVIEAPGHKWNDFYTTDQEATYTSEGLESIHCSACDQIKAGSQKVIPVLEKTANPMTVKANKKIVKVKKVAKKAQVVAPIAVSKAQGSVTYKVVGGNAKSKKALSINSKTGKIKVKKKTKKGTYKLQITVAATGTDEGFPQYKAATKTIWATVQVK